MYEQWTLSSYNVLFALLPVLCVGIFEKDVEDTTLLAVPQLYHTGRSSLLYNYKSKMATGVVIH